MDIRIGYAKIVSRLILLIVCCTVLIFSCAEKKSAVKASDASVRSKSSQKPYTVLGQRYEPLRSHERFVQTGLASWYGRDFHGKKTSNGEIYNMHAMTAAHKTLPLGVFVKVYNVKNGRETIVRVNDRGPFVKGRIIDLSYAAAKKIGIDVAGTAFVRVEALGYRKSGESEKENTGYEGPITYDSGNFTVQVGSFKERINADRLSDELKKQYGFTDVRPFKLHDDLFYRVYAGKYASLEAAEIAEKKLSENGYPGSFAVSLD
jgi:rare lipoprotein A